MPLPTFSFTTTAEEVATVFADEIKGKNVLVTGTSLNGIGFETARVIAKHANLVIITGLKLSEEAIKQQVPSADIRPLVLDLSSLAAVRKAAAEVNAHPEPLHVLIHNAAAATGPFKLTVDKLEKQLATAHIGPFLLTKLIAPKLLSSSNAGTVPRVVFVSSVAHGLCTGIDSLRWATRMRRDTRPSGRISWRRARMCSSRARCRAVQMGALMRIVYIRAVRRVGVLSSIFTNMTQKEESLADMQAFGILGPDGQPNTETMQWKTIPQGAATYGRFFNLRTTTSDPVRVSSTVAAAFDPSLNDIPGAYLDDSTAANEKVSAYCADPANGEKLWAATEEIIGEKFTF
ncbi:hypothetical protein B0H12DRAFT_1077231 [Mycena haematopus]|nr:hypothetical protein B0H12DRAFT_1077231 [Mycena haematopus]